MDFMMIFAGIVFLVVSICIFSVVATMSSVFGVIAEEDEEEDF